MIADCGWRIADFRRNGGAWRALVIALTVFLSISHVGCNQPQADVQMPVSQEPGKADKPQNADAATAANPQSAFRNPQLPADFAPIKIGILPLTELSGPSGASQGAKLSVFLTLLDAFGSPMKAPGIWRFELYEHIPRSAQAKGPRLTLWPDIDLTGPAQNHKYWRDFLRAYEFALDTQVRRDKAYILEVTCLCPDGRRLTSEYVLKSSP